MTYPQLKLNTYQILSITKAARLINQGFTWCATKEGQDYWKEVHGSLIRMAEHETSDGNPWAQSQSVDSSKPNFEMPENWYGIRVQCWNDHDSIRTVGHLFGYKGADDSNPFFVKRKCLHNDKAYCRTKHVKILPERETYFSTSGQTYEIPDSYDTEIPVWVSNESFEVCVMNKHARVLTTTMSDNGTPAYLVIPESYGENARYQYAVIPPKEPQE